VQPAVDSWTNRIAATLESELSGLEQFGVARACLRAEDILQTVPRL